MRVELLKTRYKDILYLVMLCLKRGYLSNMVKWLLYILPGAGVFLQEILVKGIYIIDCREEKVF